jgi:hypothetical protein
MNETKAAAASVAGKLTNEKNKSRGRCQAPE